MGAEIFNVEIAITNSENKILSLMYATKLSFKRNKDNKTTLTFNGDVTTGARNTGATISLEGLIFPASVDDARELETTLETDDIQSISCVGESYTQAGDTYIKTITADGVTISSDEEDWAPADGASSKLELKVDHFKKSSDSS